LFGQVFRNDHAILHQFSRGHPRERHRGGGPIMNAAAPESGSERDAQKRAAAVASSKTGQDRVSNK
jgi:hypothetical protein